MTEGVSQTKEFISPMDVYVVCYNMVGKVSHPPYSLLSIDIVRGHWNAAPMTKECLYKTNTCSVAYSLSTIYNSRLYPHNPILMD